MEAGEYGLTNAWGVFRRTRSRGVRGRRAAVVDFVVCVLGAAVFRVFFLSFFFFFVQPHTVCCKYEAALPHLSLYYDLQGGTSTG